MSFSDQIVSWYKTNKRDLPWRKTSNPYKIWLSEIILQQTRVDQGLKYYYNFIEQFPTLKELANANEQTVLKLWEGLGYYSRARNLHFTAKYIYNELNNEFPTNYNNLIKLKGIGPYTAAAIASFSSNECRAVVDGNVYRVLSRYFGIKSPIDSTNGKKEFQKLADEVINIEKPGVHNQAIMEFGALQCKPKATDCSKCPLNDSCFAFHENIVESLPVKEKKTKVRDRYFYYFNVENSQKEKLISKRTLKDIWIGLYELPLYESNKAQSEKDIIKICLNKFPSSTIINISPIINHKLSHQNIITQFIDLKIENFSNMDHTQFNIVNKKSLHSYPFPRLINQYLFE